MHKECRFIAVAAVFVLAVLVIVAGSLLYWRPDICMVVAHSAGSNGFPLFAVGTGILTAVVLMQWWTITNLWRVNSISLSDVERMHPRLPGSFEIIITLLLSVVLMTLFLQFSTADVGDIFNLSSSTSQTNDTREIAMADFDNDGDLDYVAMNSGLANDFYLNSGTGAFSRHSTVNIATALDIDAGDVDGDGDIDLVYITEDQVRVAFNRYANSSSGFTISACSSGCPVGEYSYNAVSLGDVDNDGDLDAVVSSAIAPTVFLNTGTGTYRSASFISTESTEVALASFTRDDYLDLVMVTTTGNLQAFRGDGRGAFTLIQTIGLGNLLPVLAFGDINQDGHLDVVSANSSQQLYLFTSSATGSLSASQIHATSLASIKSIAIGDIDNDGDPDLVVGSNSSGSNGGVAYYLNNGSGGFATEYTTTQTGDNTDAVALGDLDADGDLDYVRGNRGAAANRHYLSVQSATSANATPSAPTDLSVSVSYPPAFTGASLSLSTATGSETWLDPTNAGRSDDAYSNAVGLSSGAQTHYLRAANFGFFVGTGATVEGIKVDIEKKASAASSVVDAAVRLVKGGTIQTTDKADTSTTWSTTDTVATYGGASDTWGTSWTESDINSPAFGVVISARTVTGSGLSASIDSITISVYTDQATLVLTWGSGSDTESATRILQYHARLGTSSAAGDVLSRVVAAPDYTTRIASNAKVREYLLRHVPCSDTYYWSVRTLDKGLKPSAFSGENSFELDADCALVGSSSDEDTAGGSWGWSVITPLRGKWPVKPIDSQGSSESNATFTVRTFFDVNRNGIKDIGERYGFRGHKVTLTAPGYTSASKTVDRTGAAKFSLVPSDAGYTANVDPTNARGYRYVVTTKLGSTPLVSGEMKTVEVGLTYAQVLQAAPCLEIRGTPIYDGSADSLTFLRVLDNIYETPLLSGISLNETLLSRQTFFTLLSRMQCTRILSSVNEVRSKVKTELTDLPLSTFGDTERAVYSLLADGVPVLKTTNPPQADLQNRITRGDAIRAVYAAMKLPATDMSVQDQVLPVDIAADSNLASIYVTLDSLGILPQSFRTIFGADYGLTPKEAATLLSRASFVMGRISLSQNIDVSAQALDEAPVPSFLSVVPEISAQPCIESDPLRSDRFTFKDVLPGHPSYPFLTSLLQYYINDNEARKLWMVTGAQGFTEFGIERGVSIADLSVPVSSIDLLRSLLVASCRSWMTAAQTDQSVKVLIPGSIQQLSGDQVFDLPESSAVEWRVAVEAQRPDTFGNFSLFSMAPKILRMDLLPSDALTIEQASQLLGSFLAVIVAEQGGISVPEAYNRAEEAKEMIIQDLVRQGRMTRAEAGIAPFTRGMLYYFLSVVLDLRFESSSSELDAVTPSDAELWFLRIFSGSNAQ